MVREKKQARKRPPRRVIWTRVVSTKSTMTVRGGLRLYRLNLECGHETFRWLSGSRGIDRTECQECRRWARRAWMLLGVMAWAWRA